MRTVSRIWMVAVMMGWILGGAMAARASSETGSLRVYARPVESEIFIDGQHMGYGSYDGELTVSGISPGVHAVGIYNYGYVPQTYQVNIEAGKTMQLKVQLAAIGGTVSGPWGRIEVKGARHAAILLNGTTPAYVVGHGDETDADWPFKQELLVPAGTYQVNLVQGAKTIWSGPVTVEAGKKVIVNAQGVQKTQDWGAGEKLGALPRFRAGVGRTTIAVGPASETFGADPGSVNCGDSSKLRWTSEGAAKTEISGVGEVPLSGEQSVTPKATTTYTLTASGPGGTATSQATVTVNNAMNATLEVTPAEVQYHKVGEKVVEQGKATLNWSTTGAQTVAIDPLGTVSGSGSQGLEPAPKQTEAGPVNETETYTLTATNACGATETRTATLHVTGTIEPGVSAAAMGAMEEEFSLALVSIYFPTDYPDQGRPEGGLLKSQEAALTRLAGAFKKFLDFDPNARLLLEAHADVRASAEHDQALTERRAARVKEYLESQGIAGSALDTTAVGKENQLSESEVKELEAKNPNAPPKARLRARRADWLAYNRRVDIVLKPSGERSNRSYPHEAADSKILWQVPKPSWKVVEKNQ